MILTLAIIASLIAVAALVQVWRLSMRMRLVLGDSDGDRLEKQLREYHAKNKEIQVEFDGMAAEHKKLSSITALSLQKISMVRFNPFGDVGGDQSFSLAMLDGHDSGLILTSIHGRGGTRVYAKPVDLGKSKYSLSAEEKKALSQATKRIPERLKPKEK
jgi:transcriptional antiterminator Rof (Rho-off)